MSEVLGNADREALEALGYSEAWLDAGLLDLERLRAQHRRMQEGGTRKTERYRAESLAAWREAADAFPPEAIDALVAVLKGEPDAKLRGSAVADLITDPKLSLESLEHLARADAKLIEKHAGLVRRTFLARRLADGVTDALIDAVIESKDAALQSPLVRDTRLTRKQAEKLAARGANPTIRSNAQAWVQDKAAWR